jgi:hypothetical protein
MSETLYRKVGRRYEPVSRTWPNDYRDNLAVGTFRLTYCYRDGGRMYEYNVTPDTAGFVAAAMIAREALEKAICDAVIAKPALPTIRPYSPKQKRIFEKFRKDMVDAGGLVPYWWTAKSAYEIATAVIEAVRSYKP